MNHTEAGIQNTSRLLCCAAALACGAASGSSWAHERDFPGRLVRVIVPTLPGGILDTVMRVLAPKMAEVMGQNVVIDNRAGASTNIGTEIAARAAPNGYTLLINSQPLVVNPSLFSEASLQRRERLRAGLARRIGALCVDRASFGARENGSGPDRARKNEAGRA